MFPPRTYVTIGHCLARDEELRVDVIKIPLEALTLKIVPELLPTADIPKVPKVMTDPVIIILLVIIQPHLRQANRVPPEHIRLQDCAHAEPGRSHRGQLPVLADGTRLESIVDWLL